MRLRIPPSAVLLLLLLGACGHRNGPHANRLHSAPFEFLPSVQLGMRERDLTHERALQKVGTDEYFELVASFGVVYVTANQRLIGLIVPESYGSGTAAGIAFTQHQQEAFRSLGVNPTCRYDAQENRRIALYQFADGVHEISLRLPAGNVQAGITRSLFLTPSVQWRRARPQPCNAGGEPAGQIASICSSSERVLVRSDQPSKRT